MMKLLFLLHFLLVYGLASSLPLQHAKIYKDQDVSGWVMSEKLDGIRGYWDGSVLYTKGGKKLSPPPAFTQNFPPFALDGELWTKRQDFENIQSQVLAIGSRWEGVSFNIFELPLAEGDFLQRLQKAEKWFDKYPNNKVKVIVQHPCPNTDSLKQYLNTIIAKNGEGVIVKNAKLAYRAGRTPFMLKVKKAHDMEGSVIAINTKEDNKHFKSLTLQLQNGIQFKLGNGFSDQERLTPPSIGSKITFKYYGFTKYGKPKFASFIRVKKE